MKDARLVIGAVIIKHKLCLSDVETVQQIQENPYLQFFVGLAGYQTAEPFASSLLVEIRKRMGETVFEGFHRDIIAAHEGQKTVKPGPPAPPAASTQSQGSVDPVVASSEDRQSRTSPDETPPPTNSGPTATTHQGQLFGDNYPVRFDDNYLDRLTDTKDNGEFHFYRELTLAWKTYHSTSREFIYEQTSTRAKPRKCSGQSIHF